MVVSTKAFLCLTSLHASISVIAFDQPYPNHQLYTRTRECDVYIFEVE